MVLVTSWITAEAGFEWTQVHFISGYCAVGLILFRIIWGCIGPRHARFSGFMASPKRALTSLTNTFTAQPSPIAGHSASGGWAVFAMLLLVSVQAGTGLFISDDIFYAGPYNGVVSSALAGTLAQVHHTNFTLLQIMVGLHLFTIAWYQFRLKQPLVGSILHGRRGDIDVTTGITNSMSMRALVVMTLVAAAVVALVQLAPPPPVADYF